MKTIEALSWYDIVEMIELRHKIRRATPGSIAAFLSRWGMRIGTYLDEHKKRFLDWMRLNMP